MHNAERELLREYIEARRNRDEIKEALDQAEAAVKRGEATLMDHLESTGAQATGKYVGLGWVSLQKPVLYASCPNEHQERLFSWLKAQGMDDAIKRTVHARTLSSFVADLMDRGSEIPEYINTYLKPAIRLHQ
jgi:hypothetical protein